MTRTIGAAVGAVIFVLFMSYIAQRLVGPVSASTTAPHASVTRR